MIRQLSLLMLAMLLNPANAVSAQAQASDPFGGSDVKWPEPPGAFLNTKPQAKKASSPAPVNKTQSAAGQGQLGTSQWVTPASQQGNWSQQQSQGNIPQEWRTEESEQFNDQQNQQGYSGGNSGLSSSGWITPGGNSQASGNAQRPVNPVNLSQGAPRQQQSHSGQIQWLSDGQNNSSDGAANYSNNSSWPQQQTGQSGWMRPGQPLQQPQPMNQSEWVPAAQNQTQQQIGQSGWVQPGQQQQRKAAAPLFGDVLKQEQSTQGGGIPGFTPALPNNQQASGIAGFTPAGGGSGGIPGFTPAGGGSGIQGFTPSNGMAELLQNIMPTPGNTIRLPNNRPMAAAQPMRRPISNSSNSIGNNINRTISRNVNRSINRMINKGFNSLRF